MTQTRTEGQPDEDAESRVYKPRREASEGNSPADTFISDFPPPELGDDKRPLSELPLLRYLPWQPEQNDTMPWSEASHPSSRHHVTTVTAPSV